MQNILTTNTVCVDTIHSDSNLEIFSNRKIHFDTPNMLVRTLHFNKHIDNVVFGSNQTDLPDAYKVNSISENEIDISQMGEYELEMVDCLEISSKQSYQDVSGVNKEHYVNLSADNDLIVRSDNIFVENESFDDYVYRLVNDKSNPNTDPVEGSIIDLSSASVTKVLNAAGSYSNLNNMFDSNDATVAEFSGSQHYGFDIDLGDTYFVKSIGHKDISSYRWGHTFLFGSLEKEELDASIQFTSNLGDTISGFTNLVEERREVEGTEIRISDLIATDFGTGTSTYMAFAYTFRIFETSSLQHWELPNNEHTNRPVRHLRIFLRSGGAATKHIRELEIKGIRQDITIDLANRYNVTDFGTYFTNTIQCNKVSTENIYINSSGTNEEPVLNINSRSAVNLQSLKILIDDSNTGTTVDLDTYLKSRLDETDMFMITIIPESGESIRFTYDQSSEGNGFSNNYSSITAFNYSISFKIVPTGETPTDGPSTNVLDEVLTPSGSDAQLSITHDNTPLTSSYTLSNLNAGEFYDIYADVTNNFTNTIVYNVPTNGTNIPTIEHVVINSVTVVNENTVKIRYTPHATEIRNWNIPEKLVHFAAKLITPSGYTNTLDITQGALGNTFNLGDQTIVNRYAHYLELSLDISQFTESGGTSYGSYLKVSGTNAEKTTDIHSLSIVSTHSSEGFEMISPPVNLTPFDFTPPAQPSNLQLDLDGPKLFTWTESTNDPSTKLTRIFYDIFRTGDASRLNSSNLENVDVCNLYTNVLQNMDSNLNDNRNLRQGIIPGTYNIQAYNLFDQRSGFATKRIKALTVSKPTWSEPISANKQWTVSYNVTSNNGAFSISSDKSAVSGYGASSFLTELEIGTHTVYVEAEDTAMRVRSVDSDSDSTPPLTINIPTINIGNYTYVADSVRLFDFSVTINTHSYGTTSINNILTNPITVTGMEYNSTDLINDSLRFQVTDSYPSLSVFSSGVLLSRKPISFYVSITDSYGYSSEPITHDDDEIVISFDNVSSPTTEAYEDDRRFYLQPITPDTTLTSSKSFQWYGPSGQIMAGQTSIETSQLADNESYFGNFYCSITFTSAQGFTRTINSIPKNNPTPTLTITGGSFAITGSTTYDSPTYTISALNTEVSRRVTKSGSTVTSYLSSGTYTLQVKLRNELGFSKWITVGTDTVSIPTAATINSTFGTATFNSITVNIQDYGFNGDPSETPTTNLYYSTSEFTFPSGLPSSTVPLNSETSKTITGLSPGRTYYFMIVKTYPNYATVYSLLRDNSTAALVPATPPLVHSTTTPLPISVVNSDSIVLHWSPNANGDATSVTYSISIDNGTSYIVNNISSSTTSYTLTSVHGITTNTTYNIIVKKVIISPSGIGLNDQPSDPETFDTLAPSITGENLSATINADLSVNYSVDVTEFYGYRYTVSLSSTRDSYTLISNSRSQEYADITSISVANSGINLDVKQQYFLWGRITDQQGGYIDIYLNLPLFPIASPTTPVPSGIYKFLTGNRYRTSAQSVNVTSSIGSNGSYNILSEHIKYQIWVHYVPNPSTIIFGENINNDFEDDFNYVEEETAIANIYIHSEHNGDISQISTDIDFLSYSRYYLRSVKKIGSSLNISNETSADVHVQHDPLAYIELEARNVVSSNINVCGLYYYPGSQRGTAIYTRFVFFHNLNFPAPSGNNLWSTIKDSAQNADQFSFQFVIEYINASQQRLEISMSEEVSTSDSILSHTTYPYSNFDHHFILDLPNIPTDATKIIITSKVKHVTLDKYQEITLRIDEYNDIQTQLFGDSINLVEYFSRIVYYSDVGGESQLSRLKTRFYLNYKYNTQYNDTTTYTFEIKITYTFLDGINYVADTSFTRDARFNNTYLILEDTIFVVRGSYYSSVNVTVEFYNSPGNIAVQISNAIQGDKPDLLVNGANTTSVFELDTTTTMPYFTYNTDFG